MIDILKIYRYVDPSSLIQSLGLQANEQQDAQEFSKLFISVLEDALINQNSFTKNIIESQFGGKYKYQTKCHTCGSISERLSKFYELDLNIKGHLKLTKCLDEFFKEEILEGDNLYHCPTCQSKQKATRKIVLETLPPVLNLQLLRFIFDRYIVVHMLLSPTSNVFLMLAADNFFLFGITWCNCFKHLIYQFLLGLTVWQCFSQIFADSWICNKSQYEILRVKQGQKNTFVLVWRSRWFFLVATRPQSRLLLFKTCKQCYGAFIVNKGFDS